MGRMLPEEALGGLEGVEEIVEPGVAVVTLGTVPVLHKGGEIRQVDERVVVDVARYPVVPLFGVDGGSPASLHRWTIDLAAGTLKNEQLDQDGLEFPRLDERRAGLAYRHGYAAGIVGDGGQFGFNAILHYDFEKGTRPTHELRPGSTVGEPVFVPRSADAPEGQGFLLAPVYRADENRSDLLVLDAENVEHARTAGADEVIESTKVGFALVAHAVRFPGTASTLSGLVNPTGHSLFVGKVPESVELPADFRTVASGLKETLGVMVIGIRTARPTEDLVNPPEERQVRATDRVLYLASEPVMDP